MVKLVADPGDTGVVIAKKTLLSYLEKLRDGQSTYPEVVDAMQLLAVETSSNICNQHAALNRFHERLLETGSIVAMQAARISDLEASLKYLQKRFDAFDAPPIHPNLPQPQWVSDLLGHLESIDFNLLQLLKATNRAHP